MQQDETPVPHFLTGMGGHEEQVRALFKDGFAFTGDSPEFQTPLVLLGFFNRSGSNLLGSHLRDLNGVGGFKENLNHPVIRKVAEQEGLTSFPDYFRYGPAKQAKFPKKIVGYKASWDQVLMLKRARIDQMYQGVRLMHIMREDLISQAISLVIAQQTQQWTSEQTGNASAEPVYDAVQIGKAVQVCAEAGARMQMLAQFLDIPYLRVSYEALTGSPTTVMTQVGDFLGRDLSHWTPGEESIKRQATGLNEDWRARFTRDASAALL